MVVLPDMQGIAVPQDEFLFVDRDFVTAVCCPPYCLSEDDWFALEDLVERILSGSSEVYPSQTSLLGGISGLPAPVTVSSKFPILLPVVELAVAVGKCSPESVVRRGKPWSDRLSFGFWRFMRSDIVWTVERQGSEITEGKSQQGFLNEYLLSLWINVFDGGELPWMGILEQAVLFSHPEDYLMARYGLRIPHRVQAAGPTGQRPPRKESRKSFPLQQQSNFFP